ncbi:MAG: nucleotidyltransferase family protein [Gemmiger sp.]|nr:nucleotidyltransferase family protein [Gemmiger sp.]
MDFVGIVAEYDPFHNGHAAQLAELRRRGAKNIAVCISTGLTQRGGIPLFPTAVRVRAALLAGADIIVSLPAPYACAGAEAFAAAGVHLLTALGCDTLAFGAETPDAAALMRAARLLQGPALAQALRQALKTGATFAAARAAAAETLAPGTAALLRSPNDILGVEYCKAILAQNSPLVPLPLPRLGVGHDAPSPAPGPANTLDGGRIASASYLRAQAGANMPSNLRNSQDLQELQALQPFVPPPAWELYRAAAAAGQRADPAAFSLAVLACLRTAPPSRLAATRGLSEGLEHRFAAAIAQATTVEELYAALKTRRYPHARLRRLVLDGALGITAHTLPALPPYLQLLGGRKAALTLAKGAALPVSTSLARLAESGAQAALVCEIHSRACDFSALCREQPLPAGLAFTTKPVVL